MRKTALRCDIADYLNVGGETEKYLLMGAGFNSLDENPTAQTDSKTYINQKVQSSQVKSYQTQFPFDTDMIYSEETIMALYEIGRNQKTGGDAELDYVRVELFQPVKTEGVTNTFEARKFRVTAAVTGISGAGGEAVKVTGTLYAVGDPVMGTFDTTTMKFTAKA